VIKKNLLRTGVMAIALTLAAMLIPASSALADSGGGCLRDDGVGFSICISVRSGTTDPLIGDAYNVGNTISATYGYLQIQQFCPHSYFHNQSTQWYIPGQSHSPTSTMNHLDCPGHGYAYVGVWFYDSNLHYLGVRYSYDIFF
jgi:hypothetical protein